MSIFLWSIVVLGIVGMILNVYKKKSCFVIWVITNTVWIVRNYRIGEYEQSAAYIIMLAFTIWGYIKWGRDESSSTRG